MKKILIPILCIAFVNAGFAQDGATNSDAKPLSNQGWFDLQVIQHFGLNSWSNVGYVNKGFSSSYITELRGVLNLTGKYWGVFADMGIGFMPGTNFDISHSINQLPMPNEGTRYYLREVIEDPSSTGVGARFRMTFGLTGKININENLLVTPYFGSGFITMPKYRYKVLLKEDGTNMQYETDFVWNYMEDSDEGDFTNDNTVAGLVSLRANFKYKLTPKMRLLFGLEYTHILKTVDFHAHYTNSFNANIEKEIDVKGKKMNMLGISVGLAF